MLWLPELRRPPVLIAAPLAVVMKLEPRVPPWPERVPEPVTESVGKSPARASATTARACR